MTTNLPAPEWFNPEAIFAKLAEGTTSDAVAKSLGVKRAELVKQIKAHQEAFKELRTVLTYIRYEDAIEDQLTAAEAGDYQKVKCQAEIIRSCQWEIERVYRQVYGETKEKQNDMQVLINIDLHRTPEQKQIEEQAIAKSLEASAGRVVDAEVIQEKSEIPQPPRPAALSAQPAAKKKAIDRSVTEISAPVPPSPRPGSEPINYEDVGIA